MTFNSGRVPEGTRAGTTCLKQEAEGEINTYPEINISSDKGKSGSGGTHGFASMDEAKQQEAPSRGGRAANEAEPPGSTKAASQSHKNS